MKKSFLSSIIFSIIAITIPAITLAGSCSGYFNDGNGGYTNNGEMLSVCMSGCNEGCQPGYYLSDGDGDATNNCEKEVGGNCVKSNLKGVCEVCPVGFYCKGGFFDKIPCPAGTYNNMIGGVSENSCRKPQLGYCVAKAEVTGNITSSIPSVCIENSLTTSTGNSGLSEGTTRGNDGQWKTDGKVDIKDGYHSNEPNHIGIKGYTLNNNLGANIEIPCPFGTYDKRTSANTGNTHCVVPDPGYCTSSDGVNCTFTDGAIKSEKIGNATASVGGHGVDISTLGNKTGDEAIITIIRNGEYFGTNPNYNTGLGATKQIKCKAGTYDIRTKLYSSNEEEIKKHPAPACVYPDLGYYAGSAGSKTQTECPAGTYDGRRMYQDSSKIYDEYEGYDFENIVHETETGDLIADIDIDMINNPYEIRKSIKNVANSSCKVCPGEYTNSAVGSIKVSECYLTTTAGKYVDTIGENQVICLGGNYCPGGTKVNFGSVGGRTICKGGNSEYKYSADGAKNESECYLITRIGFYATNCRGEYECSVNDDYRCFGGVPVYYGGPNGGGTSGAGCNDTKHGTSNVGVSYTFIKEISAGNSDYGELEPGYYKIILAGARGGNSGRSACGACMKDRGSGGGGEIKTIEKLVHNDNIYYSAYAGTIGSQGGDGSSGGWGCSDKCGGGGGAGGSSSFQLFEDNIEEVALGGGGGNGACWSNVAVSCGNCCNASSGTSRGSNSGGGYVKIYKGEKINE